MKAKLLIILNFMLLLLVGASSKLLASTIPKIVGPNTIQKEQYQVLTLSDILNLYTSDLGGVSVQEDNYTGNGALIGEYTIELIASDGLEQVSKEITIEVLSAIGYRVRAVTDKVNIHISKANKLNPADIVNVHTKTGVFVINQTSQMEILTDEYSRNHDESGSYLFEYRIIDSSGFDKTVSCYITVYENDRIENIITIDPPASNTTNWSSIIKVIITTVVIGGIAFAGFNFLKKRGRRYG